LFINHELSLNLYSEQHFKPQNHLKEVIDLYAKLLIGTFSFIGPSFTLLIPIFFPAIQRSLDKHKAILKNLNNLNLKEGNEGNFESEIRKGNRELKKLIKQNEKEIDLLLPGRQVRRLFISLFSAIIFVECYYFEKSSFVLENLYIIRRICIALSVLGFSYCLFVLWQIFCTIIKIKSEEKEDKRIQLENAV